MNENKKVDIKKYFDPKNFNTLIVGSETVSEPKGDQAANIIDLLTNDANKELKQDVYKILKEQNATPILVGIIQKIKKQDQKQKLVAACWEANLDCNSYLNFFVDLFLNDILLISLEAATVVESMEGPFNQEDLKKSIKKLDTFLKQNKDSEKEKIVFADGIYTYLQNFIES